MGEDLEERFKGVRIGIKDIKDKEIREGDTIKVQHINYMGTEKETLDEEFEAGVVWKSFNAAFMYYRNGEDFLNDDGYIFNHRSSRYEILNR